MTNGVKTTHPELGRVSGDQVELAFAYWPGRGAPLVALHGLTASWNAGRSCDQFLAGMHQDVECVINHSRPGRSEVLKQVEIWPALVINSDDLAIDHCLVR